MHSFSPRGVGKKRSLTTGLVTMPSFNLHAILATTSILFLTATPSLSSVLCNKGAAAISEQVVVANLEEDTKEDRINLPVTETGDQSFTTQTPDHTSSQ